MLHCPEATEVFQVGEGANSVERRIEVWVGELGIAGGSVRST
jgi:hypothetical protein